MKKLFKAIMLSSVISFSAMAGLNGGGNGGGVHYCSDSDVRMYDLYEGFNRYNLVTYVNPSYSMDDYINRALNKLKNKNLTLFKIMDTQLEYMKKRILLRNKLELELVGDANFLFVDEGCEYKQLANWDEFSGNIIIRNKLYQLMSDLDKAALFIHESVYKMMRMIDKDTENSDLARYLVAELMSEQKEVIPKGLFDWSISGRIYAVNFYDDSVLNGSVGFNMREVENDDGYTPDSHSNKIKTYNYSYTDEILGAEKIEYSIVFEDKVLKKVKDYKERIKLYEANSELRSKEYYRLRGEHTELSRKKRCGRKCRRRKEAIELRLKSIFDKSWKKEIDLVKSNLMFYISKAKKIELTRGLLLSSIQEAEGFKKNSSSYYISYGGYCNLQDTVETINFKIHVKIDNKITETPQAVTVDSGTCVDIDFRLNQLKTFID